MDESDEGARPLYARLSGEERARFLAVLRETGNRRAAAAAIGVEPRLMDQRRAHDPELDRDWEAAALEAHRRLSAAEGPFDLAQDRPLDCPDGPSTSLRTGKLNMIRRGKRGRLQLVAAGDGRWTAEVELRFKEALRASGNVRAAARSVGFSESAVWQRRRQWPAFAEMLEGLLEEAELTLELRIASMGSNVIAGEGMGTVASNCPLGPPPLPFDAGKARFAGAFPELEDELAGFTAAGWHGAGASPDRADAMIWAMTELAVKPPRAPPRIRTL